MRRSERPLAGAKDSKRHPFPVAPRKDFCVPFAASRLCVRSSKIRSVRDRVKTPTRPRKRLSSARKNGEAHAKPQSRKKIHSAKTDTSEQKVTKETKNTRDVSPQRSQSTQRSETRRLARVAEQKG